jgi:hypothetical protein
MTGRAFLPREGQLLHLAIHSTWSYHPNSGYQGNGALIPHKEMVQSQNKPPLSIPNLSRRKMRPRSRNIPINTSFLFPSSWTVFLVPVRVCHPFIDWWTITVASMHFMNSTPKVSAIFRAGYPGWQAHSVTLPLPVRLPGAPKGLPSIGRIGGLAVRPGTWCRRGRAVAPYHREPRRAPGYLFPLLVSVTNIETIDHRCQF